MPSLRRSIPFGVGLSVVLLACPLAGRADAQSTMPAAYPSTGYPTTDPGVYAGYPATTERIAQAVAPPIEPADAPVAEPIAPPPPPELPPIPKSYAELLPPAPPIELAGDPAPSADPALVVPAVEPAVTTPIVEAPAVAVAPVTDALADAVAAPAAEEPAVVEAPTPWYYPSYWFGPAPWDSGIELGLNGASGTSESLSFRTGGFIKREADDYKFDGSLYYNKTQSEGIEIQSNALLDVRYDWLFDDSPWTLFVLSQTFYDEFQAFDLNFNANAGFGYRWLDNDRQKLTTSVGTGASREFGGIVRDEWVAEASFGVNYELQMADNKKFYAKADWFPEWEDFGAYRVLADVGMEVELHQPSNLSLKLSATDRYDSQPDGVEPHNLNYSALLILKL